MKYIVYLTTNTKCKINGINRIYIGVHKTENPEIFDGYIGCGVNIYKPSTYMYPKTTFQYAVKKYGVDCFIRSVLFVYDKMEDAYNKESEIVNNDFIKQSHVYNTAIGGHGGNISDPKLKCLPVYQFDLLGNLVHCWETTLDASDFYSISCDKLTKSINGYYEFIGYYWSRNNSININNYKSDHKKYTYLYNADGKLIHEFISRTECSNFLNCTPQSISYAIRNETSIKNHYVSDRIVDIFIPKPHKVLKNSKLHLYNVNNTYYGYLSKKEITNLTGLNTSAKIMKVINENCGWYKDFFLSFDKLEVVPDKKTHYKKIEVYTKDGNFIECINSVKETKEKYKLNSSQLNHILKGTKEHKQYIFKYSK